MSKHRNNAIDVPGTTAVFGSGGAILSGQNVLVTSRRDEVNISLTPEAAVVLARVLVNGIVATRGGELVHRLAPVHDDVDPTLWRDVAKALNIAVLVARDPAVTCDSRYVAPRPAQATGRRRRATTPLTVVGADR